MHSVESLITARYFMFSQVYYHPQRQAYDHHLKDYLFHEVLDEKPFPCDLAFHQAHTDTSVWGRLLTSGSKWARPILERKAFKEICRLLPGQMGVTDSLSEQAYQAACARYGAEQVRRSRNKSTSVGPFPVLRRRRDDIISSHGMSPLLEKPPPTGVHYVFVHPDQHKDAVDWFIKTCEEKKGNPD
ncbi:MAG: hypothetical protein AB1758_33980, partial [Candidatus Eremiobacterota bacterium]